MDETLKAIDDHIDEIDVMKKHVIENGGNDIPITALMQAKSTALLAKVIAHGIKEAAE